MRRTYGAGIEAAAGEVPCGHNTSHEVGSSLPMGRTPSHSLGTHRCRGAPVVGVAIYLTGGAFGLLFSENLTPSDTAAGIQGLAAAVNYWPRCAWWG